MLVRRPQSATFWSYSLLEGSIKESDRVWICQPCSSLTLFWKDLSKKAIVCGSVYFMNGG
jgi:hypothetical protein